MKNSAWLLLILSGCLTSRPPAEEPAAPEAVPLQAQPEPPTAGELDNLPPPLPPPAQEVTEPPPPTMDLADPLEFLWGHRLNFATGGVPLVTIRLAEGRNEIVFRALASARLLPRGGEPVSVAAGETLRARIRDGRPAMLAQYPLLSQFEFSNRAGLEAAVRRWDKDGTRTRVQMIGSVYGIAGKVIDNRRYLLLAEGDGSQAWEAAFAENANRRHGQRPATFSEILRRPSGRVEVVNRDGKVVASGDALVSLEVQSDAGFVLEKVGHDSGEASRDLEDRAFRGQLHLTVGTSGKLTAVNAIALEELLRSLVPSEMPASAPLEALKAQAVTARSNVLAQVGTRHLTDPYQLCSDVHCQVYRGEAATDANADAAVLATRGEALFGKSDRRLVDAVYSAMCGGHGENNEAIWGNLPDKNLRGKTDLPARDAEAWRGSLADEKRLAEFLTAAPAGWCGRVRGSHPDRYRWVRRIADSEMEAMIEPLGIGQVSSLEVTGRGVSGRARTLRVTGTRGATTISGELRIRRQLGNLPSAMFLVSREASGWLIRGGGWGHGAGMCQWGAVGRAQANQDYRQILRAYYSGAEVTRIY